MKEPELRNDNTPEEAPEQAPIPGLSSLRIERVPSRDLWPGIESRVRVQRARQQRSVWLAAAGFAAVTAMAATLLLNGTGGWHRMPAQQTAALQAPAEIVAATRPSSDASLQQANYVLHPETRALVRANLKIVNSAESQLRKAMESDPDSAYLRSLMATTRQQKQQLQLALSDDGD